MTPKIEPFKSSAPEIKEGCSKVDEIYAQSIALDVCSSWTAEGAMDLIVKARGEERRLESSRKELIYPHKEEVNQINRNYRSFTEKLQEAIDLLHEKIDQWKANCKEDPFLEEKISAEPLRSQLATSYEKMDWDVVVENLSIVPREFLRVDEDRVKVAVKSGIREIPGLQINQVKKTIIREI